MTIFRHEMRILRHDPLPMIILIVMPVALMALLGPTMKVLLEAQGYRGPSGAEQAVPGMTVLFAFFLVGAVGFSFFRDHGWGTWDRVRATPASTAEIIAGKTLPIFMLALVQQVLLFTVGVAALGLDIRGSLAGVALVGTVFAACLIGLGLVVSAIARTVQQVDAIANVGALVLAGLGGALTPVGDLPGWAQAVTPVTPAYWALRGFRSTILGGGFTAVLLPAGVLAAFAGGFLVIGLLRLRMEEVKISVA
jgi:ABC-2 type transport system permease protein